MGILCYTGFSEMLSVHYKTKVIHVYPHAQSNKLHYLVSVFLDKLTT